MQVWTSRVTKLGGAVNMSCKGLELYLMDAYLRFFNLINSIEALSQNIIRMEWPIATK